MAPKALQKAQALRRHATYLGVRPEDGFYLPLTTEEIREFLDFLAAGGMGEFEHQELLLEDIAKAPLAVCSLFLGIECISSRALH